MAKQTCELFQSLNFFVLLRELQIPKALGFQMKMD